MVSTKIQFTFTTSLIVDMKKVIIFGISDFASLAHYYLQSDSEFLVVGFSADKNYLPASGLFEGLPVLDFQNIENELFPSDFYFFAPMSPQKMNISRKQVYERIIAKGYKTISYISSKATVFQREKIGTNCFILENNTIQPFVDIRNNVILWSGNHIGHHSVIHNHTFLTSHVVLSGHCEIMERAYLGVNCSIKDGLTIGEGSFVAMGTVVAASTPSDSIIQGNPGVLSKVPASRFFK